MTGCDRPALSASFGRYGLFACLYCPASRYVPTRPVNADDLRTLLAGKTCADIMTLDFVDTSKRR